MNKLVAVAQLSVCFVLLLCISGSGQNRPAESGSLIGAWVFMEGENKDDGVVFLSNGRGYGFDVVGNGCGVSANIIHDGAGNVVFMHKYGVYCVVEFAYEKVGDALFISGIDGKPLAVKFNEMGGSSISNPAGKVDSDKWSFEFLENGKYLKLNRLTLRKVDDYDTFVQKKTEMAKQKTKEFEDAAKLGSYNKILENAKAAFGKDDYDGTISYASEAIKILSDSDEEAYVYRGGAYLNKKNYDKAIEDFNQVVKLKPNSERGYRLRAMVWQAKKNYDNAIADYSESIRINPENEDMYNERGWSLALKGDYDRAIADCNIAIKLKPNFANAYDSRAFAYAGKKDYDRAISDYTKALQLDPKMEGSYLERGKAYTAKGEYKKAADDFVKFLQMSEDSEKIKEAKAGIERIQKAAPNIGIAVAIPNAALIDNRDKKVYKTTTIANKTWMSENLKYNNQSLYTWDAALKACPAGTHLPSDEEWQTFETYFNGGKKLGLLGGQNVGEKLEENEGTFSIPRSTGWYNGFQHTGRESVWWSSTEGNQKGNAKDAWVRIVRGFTRDDGSKYSYWYREKMKKQDVGSVRCIKD